MTYMIITCSKFQLLTRNTKIITYIYTVCKTQPGGELEDNIPPKFFFLSGRP